MSARVFPGDCLESMRGMPDASVNCCVTSPPYFGLRDYGVKGQIGLESTPEEFVANLVNIFREVRRVLKNDGTLWLVIGDSFNAAGRNGHGSRENCKQGTNRASAQGQDKCRPSVEYLKPKDLIGIPWMVAFALRTDGWYLRSDIIWAKPNPMPESVTDRPTKSHEYIFLFSKNEKYYYDHEAVKEPAVKGAAGSKFNEGKTATHQLGRSGAGERIESETRNRRDVWTVASQPFSGAHFATFPPKLIEPCILAGCPAGGIVLDPFGGAFTTGMVAQHLNRAAWLCELNPEYIEIGNRRLEEDGGIFCTEAAPSLGGKRGAET